MASRKKTIQIIELVIQVTGFIITCIAFADVNKELFNLRAAFGFLSLSYTSFSWCPAHVSTRYKFAKIVASLILASASYCFLKTAMGYGYVYMISDYVAMDIIFGILFTYITIFVVRNIKRNG